MRKKLAVRRERIRQLDPAEGSAVAGGGSIQPPDPPRIHLTYKCTNKVPCTPADS